MKNIWSTHTVCLDWLQKCTMLCNPGLRSYFSLFWSISYFTFNHIGQTAGRRPGAISQMVSLVAWPVSTGHPATTSLFFKNALCMFCFPTCEAEQHELVPRDQLWKLVKFFLKHNELVQAGCLAHWFFGRFPFGSASFPAGRAELITLDLQLQPSPPVPWHLHEMTHLGEAVRCIAAGVQHGIFDGFAPVILFDVLLVKHPNVHFTRMSFQLRSKQVF